jgi:hypothetical protein
MLRCHDVVMNTLLAVAPEGDVCVSGAKSGGNDTVVVVNILTLCGTRRQQKKWQWRI